MNALLPDSKWDNLIERLQGRRWGFYQFSGNVGDNLIEEGTKQLLNRTNIDWKYWSDNGDFQGMLLGGGGNLGDLWQMRNIRQEYFKKAKQRNIPVIILPQSFTGGTNDIPDWVTVFTREEESKKLIKSIMCPDMSFCYIYPFNLNDPIYGEGTFLRKDREGLFTSSPSLFDPIEHCSFAYQYIEKASKYTSIKTDRLHFAIAGLIAKRKVTLLPNSYYKNFSMWKTCLCIMGCLWRNNP